MTTFRFPNESDEYRARRNELLELEKDIRARVDATAKKRRELPLGGRLKEDYRFERLGAGGPDGEVEEIAFEELFGDHGSLLLYTMMFGPDWDAACPSCTNIVDGLNATYYPVSQRCAMAVVAAARPAQLHDWAQRRGWTLPLYSAGKTRYILDYFAREDTTNPAMVTMMNAFRRTPEGIFHTWGSELVGHPKENGHPCHVDAVWPYWHLLDMTRDGRGEASVPIQNYEHVYFSRNVLGEED